jgi:hypothetical protein
MKTARVTYAIALLALAFLLVVAVPNSEAKKIKEAPDQNTPVPTKVIKAVDVSAGTVQIEFSVDKSTHIYKVDAGTTIVVNGGKGKLSDLKVGMQVTDLTERDSQSLDSISVTG